MFAKPNEPDLMQFASGVVDAPPVGTIDDGNYGDPLRDTRSEYVKSLHAGEEHDGWSKPLVIFKR